MGLFGFLGKAITGPFRGVGKLLSGDVKGALGAFGDTLKVGAPFIPGVGIPAAIGLSALGGGLQTLDDPNQGVGDWLKNIGGGAAWGGAAGGGLQGIKSLLSAGKAASAPVAMIDIPAAAPSMAARVGQGIGMAGNWIKDAAGNVLNWSSANPLIASQALSTGTGMIGAGQQQAMYNQQREEEQRRYEEAQRRQQLQQMIQMMSSFRPRY